MNACNLTVGIPTYNRPNKLLKSLNRICQCNPQPNEFIIHIDGDDTITEKAIADSEFKNIIIIKSPERVGPGGGRNKIIDRASNSIIASFDDDSYPLDADYFQRLIDLFAKFPKAAVIGAAIYHLGETVNADTLDIELATNFIGCGCAYRRDVFLQTTGYVCLPLAYGMEEVDLSLRLHDLGWQVLSSSWLRVFHNTALEHRNHPDITAASIANQMLLAYLRYPIPLFWIGLIQCGKRIIWLIQHQKFNGIGRGIALIPKLICKYKAQRQTVSFSALISYLTQSRATARISLKG